MGSQGLAALPAVILLVGTLAYLLFGTLVASVSWYDDQSQLRSFPPTLDNYADFVSGLAGPLLWRSLTMAVLGLLAATAPAAAVGYFLALRAPKWARRWGIFLLLSAWALTSARTFALLHIAQLISPLWVVVPWLPVRFGEPPVAAVAYIAIPPMALAVSASLRGDFLGLRWAGGGHSRIDRLLKETIPRGSAGLLFGSVLAGAALFIDPVTTELYGGIQNLGIGSYIAQASLVGGAPQAAVAAVIATLVLVGAAIAGLLLIAACLLVSHRLARVGPLGSSLEGDGLSRIAFVATALATVLTLYTLFVPLAAAVVFSFNGEDSVIELGGFTTEWWVGGPTRTGLLGDPFYVSVLWNSYGFAAAVAAAALPLALLASWILGTVGRGPRLLLRLTLYSGLAIPMFLLGAMGLFALRPDLSDPTQVFLYAFLVHLPLALGIAFLMTGPPAPPNAPAQTALARRVWIRRAVVGFLAAFAFVLGAYMPWNLGYSQSVWIGAVLARRILTPRWDVAVAVLIVATLVPIAAAWLVHRDREPIRF